MTPASLREWIAVVRDLGSLLVGLTLAVYLPFAHELQPWHLPLIGGLIGVPLLARGGSVHDIRESKSSPRLPPPPDEDAGE